jgi:hypothetical protein
VNALCEVERRAVVHDAIDADAPKSLERAFDLDVETGTSRFQPARQSTGNGRGRPAAVSQAEPDIMKALENSR